jgi:hypothetical protein
MLFITNMAKVKLYSGRASVRKFKSITDKLVTEMKHEMDITPRDTSKSYRVMINGTWQVHNPSFPNEYPAVMTGKLKDSISADAGRNSQTPYLRFGVLPGTSDADGIGYAYFQEVGTEISAPRPWITYGKFAAKRML